MHPEQKGQINTSPEFADESLHRELNELRSRLEAAEESLRTFRNGGIDAAGIIGAHDERLVRSILAQAGEAILICDLQGIVIRASQAAEKLAAENPLFHPFGHGFPLVFPKDEPCGDVFSISAVLQGASFTGLECSLAGEKPHSKQSDRSIFLLSANPLRGEQLDILGCIITLVNITERKQNEHERRMSQARIEVQHRLIDQREQDRLQISRKLHDGPIQDLTAVSFALHSLLADLADQPGHDTLQGIKETIQKEIHVLREYCSELRPPAITRFGLNAAMLSHVDAFAEKHPEIKIHLDIPKQEWNLADPVRLAIFRIFQESLINIVKHAQAADIWIRAYKNGNRIILRIHDNGKGFDVPADWIQLAREGHLGLVGMRERADAIGGQLEICSLVGAGTTIRVVVPSQLAITVPKQS